MFIKSVKLEHYRNFTNQYIEIGPDINVFYGSNAQGKTNILEAVYLATCARSHRTGKDQDLIKHNADGYQVSIEYVYDNGSPNTLTLAFSEAGSTFNKTERAVRFISHNGMQLSKISDLMGLFHAVIFAPEDLMIVKDGPAVRRRYLDLLISQIRPSYFQDLQQFSRLLMQRNKLLKRIRDSKMILDFDNECFLELDIWTSKLAEKAAAIIFQRRIYAQRIEQFAKKALFEISYGNEELSVKYKTVSSLSPEDSIKTISTKLYKRLKTMVFEDVTKGSTSIGPHRDDLELSLNNEILKQYSSQGQQRSVVLALKLAELDIIKEDISEYPVLLLDDVMSELDSKRRGCLLANIAQAQVFVTCTDAETVRSELQSFCSFNDLGDTNISDFQKDTPERDEEKIREFKYFLVQAGTVMETNGT